MFLPLKSIQLRNFLSFGPASEPVELRALNVIVGANGSGKSNFIESVNFLKFASIDLNYMLGRFGGARQWVWQGAEEPTARLDFEGEIGASRPFSHAIGFRAAGASREIVDESLKVAAKSSRLPSHPIFVYDNGLPTIRTGSKIKRLPLGLVNVTQSVVCEEQEYDFDTRIRNLGRHYRRFQVYNSQRFTTAKLPLEAYPPSDVPSRFLAPNAMNLAGVLSRLKADRELSRQFDRYMEAFYDGYEGLTITPTGGVLQLALNESFFRVGTPITRLSDGTVRWMALLAVLLDPEPAPLICIEEPEMGLHPEVILLLADLLREASERTQLIVTTHSDTLVDALTDTPEAVLTCEKEEGQSRLKRLDAGKLEAWLRGCYEL